MVISIRNNIASLKVGRQLASSTQELATSSERLSSGLRINRASDDAAGLSVSSQLQADSRILNRAKQNLNDGISLLSIADGALSEVSSLLTRQAELAQQAANGSFSKEQRQSLNEEFQALDQEIRRIEATTRFNGIEILGSNEFSTSVTTVLDGTVLSNPLIGVASRDGKYIFGGVGAVVGSLIRFTDTDTGETSNFSFDSDSDLGAVSSQSVYAITNEGLAILRGDAGGASNLYTYDINSGDLERITDNQSVGLNAAVSGDSSTVFFTSQTLYDSGGQASSSSGSGSAYRLYSIDLATGEIRGNGQDLATNGNEIEVSADGTKAAFRTTSAPTDLYYADYSSSEPAAATLLNTELGLTITDIDIAGVKDSGEVLFVSNDDLLGTGSAGDQIFSASLSQSSTTQLTDFAAGTSVRGLKLSNDSSTLVFASQANLVGKNADAVTQMFRFDMSLAELVQQTDLDASQSYSNVRTSLSNRFLALETSSQYDLFRFDAKEEARDFDFEAGFGAEGNIITSLNSLRDALSFLSNTTITSQDSARRAFDDVNGGIASLSELRGKLGAGLSRLEVAQQVTDAQRVEYDAANSRLADADIAEESANVVRLNILQQASAALLSQTNQQPALALNLLSG